MEVETPAAPLSVAPPPTPAVPEETEPVEINQEQPVEQQPLIITSPLNNNEQMLPPGTPVHKSNETITNEDQVITIYLTIQRIYFS